MVNKNTLKTKNLIDPNVEKLVSDNSVILNKNIYKVNNLLINKNVSKDNSSSTKEWVNSVYVYNKNYIKNLPAARNVVNNLLNCYFNLTHLINGEKSKSPAIIEKRNSLNKTFVSKSEIKVTNDKVNLTVYIYNKNKKTILKRLGNVFKRRPNSLKKFTSNRRLNIKKKYLIWIKKNTKNKKTGKLNKKAYYLKNIINKNYGKNGVYFLSYIKKSSEDSRSVSLKPSSDKEKYFLLEDSVTSEEIKKLSIADREFLTYKDLVRIGDKAKKPLSAKKIIKLYGLIKDTLPKKEQSFLPLKSSKKKPSLYLVNGISKFRIKEKIKRNAINFLSDVRKVKNEMLEALDNNIMSNAMMDINEKSSSINIKSLLSKSFSSYELKYYINYLNAFCFKKLLLIYYYREIVINNNKFKNWFMLGLKKSLSNLYNKKVELNIVNQKYFYLNSDIFTRALATRVKDRNNRILLQMKLALSSVSLAKFRVNTSRVSPLFETKKRLNLINEVLKRNIFSDIRYKHVQGIRIAGAGRLSQRLTAARSLSKLRAKGSLKNTQKTHLNKNFAYLRGNVKPNVQYTNLNHKTRNGAFGLKGWISSN